MSRMTEERAKTLLGLQKDGRLSPCPDSPNCVSSQDANDKGHYLQPWRFSGTVDEAKPLLKAIVEKLPRTKVVEDQGSYLRVEFTSLIFGFVDDVEFLMAPSEGLIHFRSASRVGYSDLGANRKRMLQLAELFEKIVPARLK